MEEYHRTTCTVLIKLADRVILQNRNTIVTSLVTREQVRKSQGNELLYQVFNVKLPSLYGFFLDGYTLTEQETDELHI